VGELENELINNPIYANCAADEFHLRVLGILEDEMIGVETAELAPSNATGHLELC